ncbi:hypothetical protein DBR10_06640 [Caulobacter sp. HMWF025]|nr:hypothetical protein DBR10_06640 [Caulobacter sp. HMWF025]
METARRQSPRSDGRLDRQFERRAVAGAAISCHPGSLKEAIRDPGATAVRRPLGPGSPPGFRRGQAGMTTRGMSAKLAPTTRGRERHDQCAGRLYEVRVRRRPLDA